MATELRKNRAGRWMAYAKALWVSLRNSLQLESKPGEITSKEGKRKSIADFTVWP